jgi:hypothetical protein
MDADALARDGAHDGVLRDVGCHILCFFFVILSTYFLLQFLVFGRLPCFDYSNRALAGQITLCYALLQFSA